MGKATTGRVFACILAAAVLATWTDVRAAPTTETSFAVQLRTMGLQAVTAAGHQGRTVATVYIEVPDTNGFTRLCQNLPRVLDTILLTFEQTPMLISERVALLADRQLELGQLIERSAGEGTFRRMHIVTGSRQRGEGTSVLAVDGGSRDCQPIRNIPWQTTTPPDANGFINAIEGERAAIRAAALARAAEAEAAARAERDMPSMASLWIIALLGVGGVALAALAFFLRRSSKRRQERRRKERRAKERRDTTERRSTDAPSPSGSERRVGKERRASGSRRSKPRRLRDQLAPSST